MHRARLRGREDDEEGLFGKHEVQRVAGAAGAETYGGPSTLDSRFARHRGRKVLVNLCIGASGALSSELFACFIEISRSDFRGMQRLRADGRMMFSSLRGGRNP